MTEPSQQDRRARVADALMRWRGRQPMCEHTQLISFGEAADEILAAIEDDRPTMSQELQDDVLKLVRLAVSDPGTFVSRGRERRDGETIYEPVPSWGARAVLAALDRHPIVAIRPDRPTQWAYDQACAALQVQRQRADQAASERQELTAQLEAEAAAQALLRDERDRIKGTLSESCDQISEVEHRHAGAEIRANQAEAERNEARADLQRALRVAQTASEQRDETLTKLQTAVSALEDAIAARDETRAALALTQGERDALKGEVATLRRAQQEQAADR